MPHVAFPRPVPIGKRVVVYGPSGSGKTTLMAELARKLGLPAVDLDDIYHPGPTWDDDLSTEEFRRQVSAMLAQHPDGWVIAGNYSGVRDLILPLADTAIWLKLPWSTVYPRLAWRTVSRAMTGEEIFGGNHESLKQTFFTKDSMLWWGIHAWKPHHRNLRAALTGADVSARVYVLKSPGQVRFLLANAIASDGSAPLSRARERGQG